MNKTDFELGKKVDAYKSEQDRIRMRQNAFNVDLKYGKYPNGSIYSVGVERRFNEGNTFAFGKIGEAVGQSPSFIGVGINHRF